MASLKLEVGECELNVLKFLRATDLMFECGLTFSDALRKAERDMGEYDINPDLLDMS